MNEGMTLFVDASYSRACMNAGRDRLAVPEAAEVIEAFTGAAFTSAALGLEFSH